MSYALTADGESGAWLAQFHYGQASGTSTDFWGPNKTGAIAVVTFISLVNVTNGSGDSAQIIQTPTGITVHSGDVGAGQYNRFPLLCQFVLHFGDELVLSPDNPSAWHWSLSGFWYPDYSSRIP